MKIILPLTLAAGIFGAGCATDRRAAVFAPVGPAPEPMAAAAADGTSGCLLVYSAYDVNPEFDRPDVFRPQYTDYRIIPENGQPVTFVHNNTDASSPDPVPVNLPAGRYQVIARANGLGEVTVPVIIESRKLTTVHLETDVSLAR